MQLKLPRKGNGSIDWPMVAVLYALIGTLPTALIVLAIGQHLAPPWATIGLAIVFLPYLGMLAGFVVYAVRLATKGTTQRSHQRNG